MKSKKPFFCKAGWGIAGILFLILIGTGTFFAVDHQSRTDPQFCATCHNMKSHVDSYVNSNHLDHIHQKANVGCKDCHSNYNVLDEVNSFVRYVSGNYEKKFTKIRVDDTICTQCHISGEYLASQTDFLVRNPHESHWPNLKCADCHMSHDNQVNYCGRCHDNGGQRLVEMPIVPRANNPWASTEKTIE